MGRRMALTLLIPLTTLAACGSWFGEYAEPPLPGERLPVLTFESRLEPDPRIADLEVRLPRPTVNASWPQAGGVPNHAMHHLAAGGELGRLWRADIAAFYTSDAELLVILPMLFGIVAFFLIPDGGQVVMTFALRGAGDAPVDSLSQIRRNGANAPRGIAQSQGVHGFGGKRVQLPHQEPCRVPTAGLADRPLRLLQPYLLVAR